MEPGGRQITEWLVAQLAELLAIEPSVLDVDKPLANYGLCSRDAVALSGDLEEWLGRRLPPTLVWEHPTIAALARHLSTGPAPAPSARPSPAPSDPIAVIGIGCRFPGAPDPDSFWRLLRDGVDAITEVPADRWDLADFYDADPTTPGKTTTRWGGFLTGVDQFDPGFFCISPREAIRMDPQQRLLLEVTWEALENAGIAPDALHGTDTGVFVGISSNDYSMLQLSDPALIDAYAATGNAHCIAANRLSYLFDLHGPSIAVDTACSSSLVAVHLACQSLRARECRVVLAAGVNLLLTPHLTIAFSKAQMMAPDGRCKTFDAAANGYVRGEGCGVVVLKRLCDAIADEDRVIALVRGSAVNQDGLSNGLTAPNGLAQQAVIRAALASAGIAPHEVSYVEAHGTGTPLGDPIEVESLKAVLMPGRGQVEPCVLGSVKTNIGHLEAAAGIAGFIKTVLALAHREIPPHLHFHKLNPQISFERTPFAVPTAALPWPPGSGTRRAGVSAFGFGGTNAHVVLEEAPAATAVQATTEHATELLVLSAQSGPALRALAGRYASSLESLPDGAVADACATARRGRFHFIHRLAVTADSPAQLCARLVAFASGVEVPHLVAGQPQRKTPPKIAFLFSGQGSQYGGMARELYEAQPVFRRALDQCAELLAPQLDQPLLSVLWPAAGGPRLVDETGYTQPALFALEYALAELWRSFGVEPAVVMGHSVGEYAAACVAGVLGLEDALRLIAARGRLMQSLPRDGEMAAVFADEAHVARALGPSANEVSIAAVNGPTETIISGARPALKRVLEQLASEGVRSRHLVVSHAFHSPLMEPMLDGFTRVADTVAFGAPRLPLIANVTGKLATAGLLERSAYWRRHVREPVRFAAGMRALRDLGCEIFLEIGPSATLLGMGQRCLPTDAGVWLASLREGQHDCSQFLGTLGALHTQGVKLDFAGLDVGRERRRLALPTYPFERQRCWFEAPDQPPGFASRSQPHDAAPRHPLLGRRIDSPLAAVQFETELSQRTVLSPGIEGGPETVVPFSTYVELALAAAAEACGIDRPVLHEFSVVRPIVVSRSERRTLQVTAERESNGEARVELFSRSSSEPGASWELHALVRAQQAPAQREPVMVSLPDLRARCGDGEQLVPIAPHAPWDAALRALGAGGEFLPASFARLQVYDGAAPPAWCHASIRTRNGAGATGDLRLLDGAGRITAEATGVRLQPLDPGLRARPRQVPLTDLVYLPVWRVSARPAASVSDGNPMRWLIMADRGGVGVALAAQLEAAGASCEVAFPGADLDALLEATSFQRVVHLWSLDVDGHDDLSGRALLEAQSLGCGSALALVQSLLSRRPRQRARAWFVTLRAQAAGQAAPLLVAQSPLWGFGRVLALEHPELWGGLVDLDDTAPEKAAAALLDELTAPDGEDQIAFRQGERHVARLERCELPPRAARVRPDGTYLISGGLGGIGLVVARWLVERGARHLVLTGRNADQRSEQRKTSIGALEARGATVRVVQADASDPVRMAELFDELGRTAPPLRGILHAAGVVARAPIAESDQGALKAVLAPKLAGSWVLHQLTRRLDLDLFVSFSSISSVIGSQELAAYASANAFLDALAHHRAALGLPSLSVNWGPWSEVGMASAEEQAALGRLGVGALPPAKALATLDRLLGSGVPQAMVAEIDWSTFLPVLEAKGRRPMLEGLRPRAPPEAQSGRPAFRRRIDVCAPGEREPLLVEHLQREVGFLLGHEDGAGVDPRRGFFELGMDSLMAVDLQRRLEKALGLSLPRTVALEFPNISALARQLARACGGSAPEEVALNLTQPTGPEVFALPEDKAEALLAKELEGLHY